MAVSALSVVCIFALAIVGVAVGCNMSVCCCPIGEVKMTQSGAIVDFSYSVSESVGCPQRVSSRCQLVGDVCTDLSDLLSAKKTGGEVIVSDEESSRCDLQLSCTTDSCKNTDNWAGVYDVSGSGVVVVSVVCLLTTMLLGMFL
jgi:hypothetical protein